MVCKTTFRSAKYRCMVGVPTICTYRSVQIHDRCTCHMYVSFSANWMVVSLLRSYKWQIDILSVVINMHVYPSYIPKLVIDKSLLYNMIVDYGYTNKKISYMQPVSHPMDVYIYYIDYISMDIKKTNKTQIHQIISPRRIRTNPTTTGH